MNLLLTGGSGFIGRNVLRSLPPSYRVTVTHRNSPEFLSFLERNARAEVEPVLLDLTDAAAVARLAASAPRFDACLYLAANGDPAASVAAPAFDLQSNAAALVNLLERVQIGHFVFFSSGAVYDGLAGAVNPSTPVAPRLPYAVSKLASEHYLRFFQQRGQIESFVAVRFFGAYGKYEPERKIYGRLVRRFAFERDPRYSIRGDGRNLIDAMHVDDAVRAIHVLLTSRGGSLTLDLASHAPLTLRGLVEQAARTFGLEADISYTGDVPEYIEFFSNDTRMRDEYGFHPSIELSDGLQNFAKSLREVA